MVAEIAFAADKTALTDADRQTIAKIMPRYHEKAGPVRVVGYAGIQPGAAEQLDAYRTALDRARAVAAALAKAGIPAGKIADRSGTDRRCRRTWPGRSCSNPVAARGGFEISTCQLRRTVGCAGAPLSPLPGHRSQVVVVNPPLKIAVAGFGTVGAGPCNCCSARPSCWRERAGRRIVVAAVSARDRRRDRGVELSAVRWYEDAAAMAADPEIDVVVELIGGADGIAARVVEAALAHGKHVVTANKALMAHHGTRLAARAEEQGLALSFEASVAGGIPVIKTLREGLAGNRLRRVYGILNGTSNYILTTMRESGREFAEVLSEAQKLGYAEADPSFDIDGIDAAHKLAILASVGFGRPVDLAGVYTEGIRHISRLDIDFAEELGYRIKLLGIARLTEHGLEQRVHPCMVPRATPIAAVDGVYNAVVAEGDFVGRVVLEGRGAGALPTASAVAADLVDIAAGRRVARSASDRRFAHDPGRADRAAPGRLLHPPDGGRPAGGHRRRRGRLARRGGIARIDDPARPRAGRGGAGGVDDACHGRGGDAPGACPYRGARHRARTAALDPHRRFLDVDSHPPAPENTRSPTTPSAISTSEAMRPGLVLSRNSAMPTNAVPAVPMPTKVA